MTDTIKDTKNGDDCSCSHDLTGSVTAEVDMWLGRHFLKVNGVTLAMEGDICRDCLTIGRVWTHETLIEARDRILSQNTEHSRACGNQH